MSKNGKGKRKKRKRDGGATMAETADRHVLYEASVQSVDTETEFLQRVFKRYHGRSFHLLREDFCGTAKLACEWRGCTRKTRPGGSTWTNPPSRGGGGTTWRAWDRPARG